MSFSGDATYAISAKADHVRPDSVAKYTKAERLDRRRRVLLAQIEEMGDFAIARGGR